MLNIVASEEAEQDALKLDLDALVCEGARRMLLAALKAEVDEAPLYERHPAAVGATLSQSHRGAARAGTSRVNTQCNMVSTGHVTASRPVVLAFQLSRWGICGRCSDALRAR
jgi:hypothetical protein